MAGTATTGACPTSRACRITTTVRKARPSQASRLPEENRWAEGRWPRQAQPLPSAHLHFQLRSQPGATMLRSSLLLVGALALGASLSAQQENPNPLGPPDPVLPGQQLSSNVKLMSHI